MFSTRTVTLPPQSIAPSLCVWPRPWPALKALGCAALPAGARRLTADEAAPLASVDALFAAPGAPA
jgi:hypothetical protein